MQKVIVVTKKKIAIMLVLLRDRISATQGVLIRKLPYSKERPMRESSPVFDRTPSNSHSCSPFAGGPTVRSLSHSRLG